MQEPMRVALITGGGSGIGAATARVLASNGFAVALAGRRREPLEAVAAEIEAAGGQAIAIPADVADPASVATLFEAVEARFGRLDVLFNNAGRWPPSLPVDDLPLDEWRAALDVNLTGAFLCTQHAIRLMKRQRPRGGRIVNNGSVSAYVPRPRSAAYTAAKHAITGLTKATALDCRGHGIACGQIDVGNAATELSASFSRGVLQADGSVAPEPLFDVEHVARAVLYMATLPLDVNVLSLTVMATDMPYVGRG